MFIFVDMIAAIIALLAAGAMYERRAERQAVRRMDPPGRLVDIGGRRLHLYARAPAAVRTHEQPGELGDKPLVILAHGISFPGPATAIEADWAQGMESASTLSRNSCLIVACNSNHMIYLDEPEVVVDAVRRVHEAATIGTRIN